MALFRRPELYTLPSTFLNLRLAFTLIIAEVLFGVIGYIQLEGFSAWESFYMVIITISTVGYTEVRPLSQGGQILSAVLIILNIGIFAYLLAVFSYYMSNGQWIKKNSFYHDR